MAIGAPIRALLWGENVHEQTSAVVRRIYPEGIHGAIAAALRQDRGIVVETATLQEPEHGLTRERLEVTDVLLWWGHAAHGQVEDAIVERVQNRVWEGMGLIVLHSGHFSKIFKRLMGTPCSLKWREAGERERIWVVNRNHPIADGARPLHRGAIDRDVWRAVYGAGAAGDGVRILVPGRRGAALRHDLAARGRQGVYFSPGHETYPIYHQAEIGQVLRNAVRWAYNPAPAWTDIAEAPNVPVERAPEKIESRGERIHADGEAGLR
jgi:trehalose utilization protein